MKCIQNRTKQIGVKTTSLKPVLIVLMVAFALMAGPARGAIILADYFPMDLGRTWEYTGQVTFGTTTTPGTMSVEAAANQTIHGINTTRLDHTFPEIGAIERRFFSLTSSGLSLHREEFDETGNDYDQWVNPLNTAPAMIDENTPYSDTQDYNGEIVAEGDAWTGNTQFDVNVMAFEDVTTPAGTFNALKVSFTSTWSETGVGNDYAANGTTTGTWWLAQGIGRVKIERSFQDFEDGEITEEGTVSFELVPEPGSLALVAVGGLLITTRRLRWQQAG